MAVLLKNGKQIKSPLCEMSAPFDSLRQCIPEVKSRALQSTVWL